MYVDFNYRVNENFVSHRTLLVVNLHLQCYPTPLFVYDLDALDDVSIDCFIAKVAMAHGGPELGFWVKTLISATAGIGRVSKLQQCFIKLLGVYCEKIFCWNPVEHLCFVA